MTDEWVTYYRHGGASVTRPASEAKPRNFPLTRAATKEEIEEVQAERHQLQETRDAQAAFNARQDVIDAKFIASAIEFMEIGDGLVDRLSPSEWAELRRRLG